MSGLLILIGAVAMTKFRRVYEAAIFKTLGATRRLIAAVLVFEYGLLGVLAGTHRRGGAIALTWAISRYALDIPFTPLIGMSAIGVVVDDRAGCRDRRDLQLGSAAAQAARHAPRLRSSVIIKG